MVSMLVNFLSAAVRDRFVGLNLWVVMGNSSLGFLSLRYRPAVLKAVDADGYCLCFSDKRYSVEDANPNDDLFNLSDARTHGVFGLMVVDEADSPLSSHGGGEKYSVNGDTPLFMCESEGMVLMVTFLQIGYLKGGFDSWS